MKSWDTISEAKLVVSELANNAYLHGQGTIQLRVEMLRDRVRIELIDQGDSAARITRAGGAAANGRGLQLVNEIALAWGAYGVATCVWAELAC